jgi:phosphosulfolactate phosphohydrolase-like enzyme
MRATSTIAQALASGYERIFCCAEIEDAVALREELGKGLPDDSLPRGQDRAAHRQ